MIKVISNNSQILIPFQNLGFDILECDVKEVPKILNYKLYFVSPANSLLFMDGGIDLAYMQMFDGIEKLVKNNLRNSGVAPVSKLGRLYLPVGSAMTTEIVVDKYYMISAPTMLMPQDVSKTKNPYHAMKAILKVWPKDGILLLPPLACGYGKINPEESAKMIKMALDEIEEGYNDYVGEIYINTDSFLDEQPNYYENSEFKDIEPSDIVMH